MIFSFKASFIMPCCAALALLVCGGGAAVAAPDMSPSRNPGAHFPHILRMDEILAQAASMARAGSSRRQGASGPEPDYVEALLADGRLSIGLGIGTEDLGSVRLPAEPEQRTVKQMLRISGRQVLVEARLILTREEFKQGLAECEILFVTSHSRFGAGPVFLLDGKAYPFLMQTTPGYEIIMPDDEICGYQGRVKRQFYNKGKNKNYTVFEPDGSDLDTARPLHSYQLMVLSTCTSQKHFRDEIRAFRSIYPTTAIFTRRAACLDTGMNIFMRMLAEIFQARPLPVIVSAMNQEYRDVSERQVQKGSSSWKVIEEMYTLGINTLPVAHYSDSRSPNQQSTKNPKKSLYRHAGDAGIQF